MVNLRLKIKRFLNIYILNNNTFFSFIFIFFNFIYNIYMKLLVFYYNFPIICLYFFFSFFYLLFNYVFYDIFHDIFNIAQQYYFDERQYLKMTSDIYSGSIEKVTIDGISYPKYVTATYSKTKIFVIEVVKDSTLPCLTAKDFDETFSVIYETIRPKLSVDLRVLGDLLLKRGPDCVSFECRYFVLSTFRDLYLLTINK